MSNLGHIHGNIRQIRAKSRGAEACHCTKIIHVLITLPVCLWMSSALCYFCLSGSPLCDPVCLTQYESLIVRKRPTTTAKTFSILILTPIPHCPDNAYTVHQSKWWSYKALCPWLGCLSHKQESCCLIICYLNTLTDWFAHFNSSNLNHPILKAYQNIKARRAWVWVRFSFNFKPSRQCPLAIVCKMK